MFFRVNFYPSKGVSNLIDIAPLETFKTLANSLFSRPFFRGDGITDNGLLRSNLSSEIEIAANRLAADIIMPWHLISHALKNGRENNELAKVLKVSNGAMSIRLETPFEG